MVFSSSEGTSIKRGLGSVCIYGEICLET